MKPLVSMRRALENPNLFGSILSGESWASWRILLIAMMGEPLSTSEREVFAPLTLRDREPLRRVEQFWGCIGRRGGKTRAIAVLAAYIASLVDFSDVLAPGEKASLPILSHTVDQAQKCFSYLDGIFSGVPALKKLVIGRTADTITLSTRVVIEDFRRRASIAAKASVSPLLSRGGDMLRRDRDLFLVDERQGQRAGDGVRHVIVAILTIARRMVDRIASAARRASFERAELRRKARKVQQVDATRIDGRQKLDVDV